MLFGLFILFGIIAALAWLRSLLRINRHLAYCLDNVYVTQGFTPFPTSYDYGYGPERREHLGFAIEWLWFNFSFVLLTSRRRSSDA